MDFVSIRFKENTLCFLLLYFNGRFAFCCCYFFVVVVFPFCCFRSTFSTNTALTYLGDNIRFNLDKGLYTGVVLLDLQKAFDTVDHHILLSKLRAIGADDYAVKWFSSYLNERKQFFDVLGTFSSKEGIRCGVPQGSILGPLLFTLYVNDMSTAVNCDLCLYADDSMLLVSGKNVTQIEKALEKEMNGISDWLQANRLSLHLGKTESILFGSVRKFEKGIENENFM